MYQGHPHPRAPRSPRCPNTHPPLWTQVSGGLPHPGHPGVQVTHHPRGTKASRHPPTPERAPGNPKNSAPGTPRPRDPPPQGPSARVPAAGHLCGVEAAAVVALLPQPPRCTCGAGAVAVLQQRQQPVARGLHRGCRRPGRPELPPAPCASPRQRRPETSAAESLEPCAGTWTVRRPPPPLGTLVSSTPH